MNSEKGEADTLTVAVRVRPLLPKEVNTGAKDVVRVLDGKMVVMLDAITQENDYLRANRSKEKRFAFDHAFDPHASQRDIFARSTLPLIASVLKGINGTVFAYGATGAGKTHTMLGTRADPGVMVLALQELFIQAHADRLRNYTFSLSYLEVYNEEIHDLLVPNGSLLDLREDPVRGVFVSGLQQFTVTSADEVMDLLQKGNGRRTTEATRANETSSRSHAVLQIFVQSKEKTANIRSCVRCGKLSLIDLAGSERAAVTQNRGMRLVEGAKINRSLLALANCINALADKSKKGSYVNYRDSKLTRLLKDSLGGKCRTSMVANVSPNSKQFEETYNTLKYADRAKEIKIKASSNIKNVDYHISEYKKIIEDLHSEIQDLRLQLSKAPMNASQPIVENTDMENIRTQIMENFEHRLQLRRSLIEVEDQNFQNSLDIEQRQTEIIKWEAENPDTMEAPPHIVSLRSEVETIFQNMERNTEVRLKMGTELADKEAKMKRILADLPKWLAGTEHRKFLELLVHSQTLEITNMELELHLQVRDKVIDDQRRIIETQRVLLLQHHAVFPEVQDDDSTEKAPLPEQRRKSIPPPESTTLRLLPVGRLNQIGNVLQQKLTTRPRPSKLVERRIWQTPDPSQASNTELLQVRGSQKILQGGGTEASRPPVPDVVAKPLIPVTRQNSSPVLARTPSSVDFCPPKRLPASASPCHRVSIRRSESVGILAVKQRKRLPPLMERREKNAGGPALLIRQCSPAPNPSQRRHGSGMSLV